MTDAGNDQQQQQQRAFAFHQLHARPPLVLPNAWDAGSALVVEAAVAAAIATTSAGVAWAHGRPDGHAISPTDAVRAVATIAEAVAVPVTADIEGGYGPSPADVAAIVNAVVHAGAVGVNLEDSDHDAVQPALLPVEVQAERIVAARAAGTAAGVELWINARTDSYLVPAAAEVDRLDATLSRAVAYAEAGADSLFVPGTTDRGVIARLVAGPLPVNVMVGPGAPSVTELADLGVARISVGSAIAQTALRHVQRAAAELLGPGTYHELADSLDYHDLNELCPAQLGDRTSDPTTRSRNAMPYTATIGVRVTAASADEVRADLDWAPWLCTTNGALHGGAMISLADAAGAILAFHNLPDTATGTTTVASTTNFLRAVHGGTITATSRLLHRGRSTLVVDTDLRDDAGRLIARVTQTQAVLQPR